MSSRKYTWNAYESSLSGGIDASQTSIILVSATNLRSPGILVIEPDNAAKREFISFTGISTNTLTGCTRGLPGGQSGTAHDSGVVIRAVPVHQFFDDLFTDIEALETSTAAHYGGIDVADHPEATASARGFASAAQITKLDGIEALATIDQTAAEILAALLTVDGAGSGLDADLLDGLHAAGFTVIGHTGAGGTAHADVIDGGSDGFMTGAQSTKLTGIETAAKDDQTAAEILALLLTVDGAGSGLDADLLDGVHGSGFAAAAHTSGSDHDGRYYTETEIQARQDEVFGADGGHGGRRIFFQSSTPTATGINDLWVDTT